MTDRAADEPAEADRRLPRGEEVFLDHVAHFVADAVAATRALARAGFAPTPVSIQVDADPAGGPPRPTGTGNVTAMLDRGYLEVLFRTADTPLGREFEAATGRYHGVHLAAFAVADADDIHARLLAAGFAMRPVAAMQRPVATAQGDDVAAFAVVRLLPGQMPEGRIQALAHRTEHTVWQERWLKHPNGAAALLDIVIGEADLAEASARFTRFLGRGPRANPYGSAFHLDRGRVQLMPSETLAALFPGLPIPSLPFMTAYGVGGPSLAVVELCLKSGGIPFERRDGCVIAPFPDELGIGCWAFVEHAAALPWRR